MDLPDRLDIEAKKPARRVIGLEPGQPPYAILVVEDNPENRALLSKLLRSVGFEVHEAGNGQEAIEQYEKRQPDLIWMDMRMPVMDGYEGTRSLRAPAKTQKLPIIGLSAHAMVGDREKALQVYERLMDNIDEREALFKNVEKVVTDKKEKITSDRGDKHTVLKLLPHFYKSLYAHLE